MSLLWLLVGFLICYGSYRLDIGTPSSPGPGFIPFLSGILSAGSSLSILLLGILRRSKNQQIEKSALTFRLLKSVFPLFLSLVAFMFLLDFLGFTLCTLLFMGFLLRVIGSQNWKTVILGSLSITLGACTLFQWILKCQLPTGMIGF